LPQPHPTSFSHTFCAPTLPHPSHPLTPHIPIPPFSHTTAQPRSRTYACAYNHVATPHTQVVAPPLVHPCVCNHPYVVVQDKHCFCDAMGSYNDPSFSLEPLALLAARFSNQARPPAPVHYVPGRQPLPSPIPHLIPHPPSHAPSPISSPHYAQPPLPPIGVRHSKGLPLPRVASANHFEAAGATSGRSYAGLEEQRLCKAAVGWQSKAPSNHPMPPLPVIALLCISTPPRHLLCTPLPLLIAPSPRSNPTAHVGFHRPLPYSPTP
jgi:hypothetical protein